MGGAWTAVPSQSRKRKYKKSAKNNSEKTILTGKSNQGP
jgi:hypothetical protein